MMEDVVVSVDAELLDSLVIAIALLELDIDRMIELEKHCLFEKRCKQRDLLMGLYENLHEQWLDA